MEIQQYNLSSPFVKEHWPNIGSTYESVDLDSQIEP